MDWILSNWVAVGGIVLLIVRVIESIMQIVGKDNPTLFAKVIAFVKTFFKLS